MHRYKFSVWQVIDERGTVRGTFETKGLADKERDLIASFKTADHGEFITVKEVKVYGGNADE